MSLFHCDICNELKDADFQGCEENPSNGECICEKCAGEFLDE